jgi:hypothetical protein
VEQNCVTVLKEIGLSSQLCFIPLPTALLNSVIGCSEHKTTKVMICTYWWWTNDTAESETKQHKSPNCPQCAARSEQENRYIQTPVNA